MNLYENCKKTYFSGSELKVIHLERHEDIVREVFKRTDRGIYDLIRAKLQPHEMTIFSAPNKNDLNNVMRYLYSNTERAFQVGLEKSDDEDGPPDIFSYQSTSYDEMNGLCMSLRDNYKAIVLTMTYFASNLMHHLKDVSPLKSDSERHSVMKIFAIFASLGNPKDFGTIRPSSGKVTKARVVEMLKINVDSKKYQDHITIIAKACLNAAIYRVMYEIPGSSKALSRYYSPLNDALEYDFFRDFNILLKTMKVDVLEGKEIDEINCLSIIDQNEKLNDYKFIPRNILALDDKNPEMWLDHTSSMIKYNLSKDDDKDLALATYRDGIIKNTLQVINEVVCFKPINKSLPYGLVEYQLLQYVLEGVIRRKSMDLVIILRMLYEQMSIYDKLFIPRRLNYSTIYMNGEGSEELTKYLDKLVIKRQEELLKEFMESYRKLGWDNSLEYQDEKNLRSRLKDGVDESGIETFAGSVQVYSERVMCKGEKVAWKFLITEDRGVILIEGPLVKLQNKQTPLYPQVIGGYLIFEE